MRFPRCMAFVPIAAMLLSGCGGGAGGGPAPKPPTPTPTSVYTAPAAESLSVADVEQVLAQAVAEAKARGTPAVIAVTDRIGNVLAVYQMNGAPASLVIRPGPGGPNNQFDLQGISLPSNLVSIPSPPASGMGPPTSVPGSPAALAAIAKAITGAYLSSSGNAFSSRTASEIVQDTFPPSPQAVGLGSGPLFGVQFSSLPCSDLQVPIYLGLQGLAGTIGPKPSPLGLAGDPGGFPLYKNGVVVGGIGVKTTTDYGFDPNINQTNPTQESEEAVALAGTVGFDAPTSIRADQITVNGISFIYSNATLASLKSTPASAPPFSSLTAADGALEAVAVFY
ncbi:MAG: heme-binding protein, partial [Betaproteobacteria bacterium]|nr:heme-binding protein [Betaproteobacteria bacterium]